MKDLQLRLQIALMKRLPTGGSTMPLMIWKGKVTKRQRVYSQLALSARRTKETGFGLWHSPRACMIEESPENFVRRMGDRDGTCFPNLAVQVKYPQFWPTPTVGGGGQTLPEGTTPTGKTPEGRKQTVCLERFIMNVEKKIWPTPTTAMAKGLSGGAMKRKTGKSRENDRLDYATEKGNIVDGRLNPMWVGWLMGYPEEWTNCAPTAMPSFRRLPRSSSKQ